MNSNSVTSTLKTAVRRLAQAGCDTPQLDAEVLLAHSLNRSRAWLYTHPQTELTPNQSTVFWQAVARREQRRPVAQIIGRKEFFGLEFLVTSQVLIPRPETELLVETAIALINRMRLQTVVDVGAGSGCIAIALARRTAAAITAVDVSTEALQVAQQNAARHQVTERITFLRSDLLENVAGPVDLIVSNPPYVERSALDSPATMPEVRLFEPHLALDGGPGGLEIIERLVAQAAQKLSADGGLLVEIGFEQGPAAAALAHRHFPGAAIAIKKDLAGLDRLLVAQRAAVTVE